MSQSSMRNQRTNYFSWYIEKVQILYFCARVLFLNKASLAARGLLEGGGEMKEAWQCHIFKRSNNRGFMFDLRCHFTDFHIITHKQEKENEHFSLLLKNVRDRNWRLFCCTSGHYLIIKDLKDENSLIDKSDQRTKKQIIST